MNTVLKKNERGTSKIILILLCLFFMAFLIINNGYVSRTFYDGLCFSVQRVLPTLFPFMFAGQILVLSGGIDVISDVSEILLHKANFNKNALIPCLIGILCGFPTGAVYTKALYEQGKITKNEADVILIGSNCASPAFVISAVGKGMLGSASIGFLIWSVSVISSLTITLFLLPRSKTHPRTDKGSKPYSSILKRSISGAAASIINVCFLISIFYLLCVICIDALEYFSVCDNVKVSLAGFIELCSGCKAACELLPTQKAVYCAFAAGFGGMSALLQVKAEAHEEANIAKYFISKLVCGLISSFFVFIYCKK